MRFDTLKLLSQNDKACFIFAAFFLTKNKGVMEHSLKVEKQVLRESNLTRRCTCEEIGHVSSHIEFQASSDGKLERSYQELLNGTHGSRKGRSIRVTTLQLRRQTLMKHKTLSEQCEEPSRNPVSFPRCDEIHVISFDKNCDFNHNLNHID